VKILFLTDGIFPFVIGGMQKHSLQLASGLAAAGVEVHVVHCGGKDYSPALFLQNFPVEARQNVYEVFVKFPKLAALPGHYVRENRLYSKHIYALILPLIETFDLIYAQGFTGSFFVRQKKAGRHKVPVAVNLHGFEMFQFAAGLKMKLQYAVLRKEALYLVRNADWVYSFGGKITGILTQAGVRSSALLLQANGIADEWLVSEPPVHAICSFVFIGRNERRKGVFELSDALRKLCEQKNAAFRFHFIGPVTEQRVDDPRVFYHGEIRDPMRIREIIDGCDCLVCPSYAEGMPTVILEALARGLGIIATNVGAVSRQVRDNGILLENPDPGKLQAALESFIAMKPTELLAMKKQSIALAKKEFLWSAVVASKLEDFRKISKR
jgi:glycosyltransferase involved in cell wall biosynthesis